MHKENLNKASFKVAVYDGVIPAYPDITITNCGSLLNTVRGTAETFKEQFNS